MDIAKMLTGAVTAVTAKHAERVRRQERGMKANLDESAKWAPEYSPKVCYTIRAAAFDVMPYAYNKASSDGTYPALARQIYYAARPEILSSTGANRLDSNYFTQTLLPDYLALHPETTSEWNLAYDARGHFIEPHTGRSVALGTLAVRDYLVNAATHKVGDVVAEVTGDSFPSCGPTNRYIAILFVEKEGFLPLFAEVKLAERYDIGVMSSKGMVVTAARELVDAIGGGYSVPILVLHDFDQAGFSIAATLQNDNRRYHFTNDINVIDLGLRLVDIEEYALQSEDVRYSSDPAANLAANGATAEEIEFLRGTGLRGHRVELNAFTSEQLITWIEAKLHEHGVEKVIPDDSTLEMAYRRAVEIQFLNGRLQEIAEEARTRAAEAEVPHELEKLIRDRVAEDPTQPWDQIVADLAERVVKNETE